MPFLLKDNVQMILGNTKTGKPITKKNCSKKTSEIVDIEIKYFLSKFLT